MSDADQNQPVTPAPAQPKRDAAGALTAQLVKAVNDADLQAAAARVAALRGQHPDASADQIVDILIKQKCLQTGAIGAVTSGAAIIPGLGTFASLTFGVAADIGMTFKMQAELVLEIAAAYGRALDQTEKRNVVLLVTGISAGANQALSKVGRQLAERATQRLAEKAVSKSIPVIGVAASAGTNMVSTYIIGRRAQAYFSLGPDQLNNWGENARALSGLDERKLAGWLEETTERSWQLVSSGAQDISEAVIAAGRSVGEVVVVSVNHAGAAISSVGASLRRSAGSTLDAVAGLGRRASEAVGDAAEAVSERGKQIGSGIAAGTDKVGDALADMGGRVASALPGRKRPKADPPASADAPSEDPDPSA